MNTPMDINEARQLAEDLMAEYLYGWYFEFDEAKRRWGQCSWAKQRITLSRPLTELNDRSEIEETIRHEIAHAIAGPAAKHGRFWKEACKVTGAIPKSCKVIAADKTPEHPYVRCCPNPSCGATYPAYRRSRSRVACKRCCNKYNYGRWDERFVLQYYRTGEQPEPYEGLSA